METISNFGADALDASRVNANTSHETLLAMSPEAWRGPASNAQAMPFLESEMASTASQLLQEHADALQTTFAIPASWQGFLSDIYSSNPLYEEISADRLETLREDFITGALRPELRFVDSNLLTDSMGVLRGAAFNQESETILLANTLDHTGIAEGINQELGHWWDVQLHGEVDTTTVEGGALDEGAAYAERFSEGLGGNAVYADNIYQEDRHTIYLDGEETPVEFRPIATWNLNGANRTVNGVTSSSWEDVFDVMNNPGQGLAPIEIMAVQESGVPPDALDGYTLIGGTVVRDDVLGLGGPDDGVFISELTYSQNGSPTREFKVFNFKTTIAGTSRNNLSLVVRYDNTNVPNLRPFFAINPNTGEGKILDGDRGALGLKINDNYYFSIHAKSASGANLGNDAEGLIQAADARGRQLAQDIVAAERLAANQPPLPAVFTDWGYNSVTQRFFLGDYNRDGNITDNPFPDIASNDNTGPYRVATPNAETFSARLPIPVSTLDYLVRSANDIGIGVGLNAGTVLNGLPNAGMTDFPSDHFPIVFEDGLPTLEPAAVQANSVRSSEADAAIAPENNEPAEALNIAIAPENNEPTEALNEPNSISLNTQQIQSALSEPNELGLNTQQNFLRVEEDLLSAEVGGVMGEPEPANTSERTRNRVDGRESANRVRTRSGVLPDWQRDLNFEPSFQRNWSAENTVGLLDRWF